MLRIIRFEDLATIPWKNGGGITREIAVLKNDEAIVWRLSMADVASDGPFSNFSGLTRILTVIEGNGMRLEGVERNLEATLYSPITFDGGDKISSTLIDGPLRDLNVMFDPLHCSANVRVLSAPANMALEPATGRTFAVVGLKGNAKLAEAILLGFGDTVLTNGNPVDLTLGEGDAVLVVTLEVNSQTSASSLATALL